MLSHRNILHNMSMIHHVVVGAERGSFVGVTWLPQ